MLPLPYLPDRSTSMKEATHVRQINVTNAPDQYSTKYQLNFLCKVEEISIMWQKCSGQR